VEGKSSRGSKRGILRVAMADAEEGVKNKRKETIFFMSISQ
jgi:hypothetical protein